MTIVIPLTVCKFCLASGNQEICHASSSSRTGGFASIDRPTLTFPGQVLMFDKRHRITLLFNANKAYDRQVVEGVGEYYRHRNPSGIYSLRKISAPVSIILKTG